jgi:hypothetical protein
MRRVSGSNSLYEDPEGYLHRAVVCLKALLEGFGHLLLVFDDKD